MEVDAVVVGAGAVGLAVTQRLARAGWRVLVLERHPQPGLETSARNSGVVHAGIYYPTGTLKHRTCVAGNRALSAWCEAYAVPHHRTGKLIVALHPDELPALDALAEQAHRNGVPGIERLDEAQARALEPAVPAVGALLSPSTGAVDAAAYVRSLEAAALADGALVVYRHAVTAAVRVRGGFRLTVRDADGEQPPVEAPVLVNAAGHGAPGLARALGYPLDGAPSEDGGPSGAGVGDGVPMLRQRLNRGRYYDIVGGGWSRAVGHHIYPLPEPHAGGLGVHLTRDVDGALHLGPDTAWVEGEEPPTGPVVDDAREAFLAAGRRLLPALRARDLAPGQVGYRPKLQRPDEAPADFVLWHDRGYLHLGGIESPGLTASLALAEEVALALGAVPPAGAAGAAGA